MELNNLRENQEKLIHYLQDNGYCAAYIRWFEDEITWILKNVDGDRVDSYEDIYHFRISQKQYPKSTCDMKKTIIGAIKRFDLYGEYPDGRSGHSMLKNVPPRRLSPQFQRLIDTYRKKGTMRGLKYGTIYSNSSSVMTFFLALQERGEDCLEKITEESVLGFFRSRNNEKTNGYYFRGSIKAVLEAGGSSDMQECKRVISLLPCLRHVRKNFQFMKNEETEAVRMVLTSFDSGLSLRDRAIGMMLMYTGLRRCDVAGLEFGCIDWERELISVTQKKTGLPISLHLSSIVGNAIYDYLELERPIRSDPHVFLTKTHPFNPVSAGSIDNIVNIILDEAHIRKEPGDRRGAHLFRHRVATALMANGISQPVISSIMGHSSPESLGTYLHADFIHLKSCALDIGTFPVGKGVFPDA